MFLATPETPEAGQVLIVVTFQLAIAFGSGIGGAIVNGFGVTATLQGMADESNLFGPTQPEKRRIGLPNLIGTAMLETVGHWSQHEAGDQVSQHLLEFLSTTWEKA